MDKSRSRNSQKLINEAFIIKSKRIWWRELIIGFFTLLVWAYCLTVIYFFIDALFSLNHKFPSIFRVIFKLTNIDIKMFLMTAVIIFIIIFSSIYFWSYYNKKRYGSKTRRKYPKPTTKEDLKNLNMIDKATYEKLQNDKVIVFETNPVRIQEVSEKNFN